MHCTVVYVHTYVCKYIHVRIQVFSLKKVVCVETVLGAADVLEDILGPQMENSTNGMSSITMDVILLIINCCILKELVRKYDSEGN